MCDDVAMTSRHNETIQQLKQIERLLETAALRPDEDQEVFISSVNPYLVNFQERRRLYITANISAIITVEDIATVFVPANTWTDIGYQQGHRVFYPDGGITGARFLVRASDRELETRPRTGDYVGVALVAFPGNPTQTAAGQADTIIKWGLNGTRQASHVVLQNNTGSSFSYAFDQDSTASTSQVYTLANLGFIAWNRVVSVLHTNSAAQQPFGGVNGITVEAFL